MRLWVLVELGDWDTPDEVRGVFTSAASMAAVAGWTKRKANGHRIEEWEADGGTLDSQYYPATEFLLAKAETVSG